MQNLIQRVKSQNPVWAYVLQIAAMLVALMPLLQTANVPIPMWFTWVGCVAAALLQLTKKNQVQPTNTQDNGGS